MQENDLYIHFDLEEGKHFIPIYQSIITEQSIERIIKNLSFNIFQWNVDVDIFVEADDEGWLVKKIMLVIWLWVAFANTDFGSWYIEELTWKSVESYWRDLWKVTKIIIKEATEWFFCKSSKDLIEGWLKVEDFYEAYDAKNSFYNAAIANKDVKWIGFECEHNFPIPRTDFLYKKVDLRKEKISDNHVDKFHDLLVVSSINIESKKNRMWDVMDKNTKEIFSVNMDDEDFYKMYFENKLLIQEFKVRIRYYISIDNYWKSSIEQKKIVMVYEYNGNVKLMTIPNNTIFEVAPYKLPYNYGNVESQTYLEIYN